MIKKSIYAECDTCGKIILLQECKSISPATKKILRNKYRFTISREGLLMCPKCRRRLYDLL